MSITELIERLRGEHLDCNCAAYSRSECCCNTHWPESYCLQAAEALEQMAAALAAKDEAIGELLDLWDRTRESGCLPFAYVKVKAALALQSHADLVRKLKADAVREAAAVAENASEGRAYYDVCDYADRIEREGSDE